MSLEQLCAEGWTIVRDALSPSELEHLRRGFRSQSTELARVLSGHRAIEPYVRAVFRCIRDYRRTTRLPPPGPHPGPWHVDRFHGWDCTLSSIWAIDDFTTETGSTELITSLRLRDGNLRDDDQPRDVERERLVVDRVVGYSRALVRNSALDAMPRIQAVMPAGSVLIFFGSHVIHRLGANVTSAKRRAVAVFCAGNRADCAPE